MSSDSHDLISSSVFISRSFRRAQRIYTKSKQAAHLAQKELELSRALVYWMTRRKVTTSAAAAAPASPASPSRPRGGKAEKKLQASPSTAPEEVNWHERFNTFPLEQVDCKHHSSWTFEKTPNWKAIPGYRMSHYIYLMKLMYDPNPPQDDYAFLLNKFYSHCERYYERVPQIDADLLVKPDLRPHELSKAATEWLKGLQMRLFGKLISSKNERDIQKVLTRLKIDRQGKPNPPLNVRNVKFMRKGENGWVEGLNISHIDIFCCFTH